MDCKMTLSPLAAGLPEAVVSMTAEDGERFAPEDARVYRNSRYRFRLSHWNGRVPLLSELKRAVVLVNGETANVQWSDRKDACFQGEFTGPNGGMVFRDAFGFVEIIILLNAGGRRLRLCSGFLTVMVRDHALNQSVEEMAAYVYARREAFLSGGRAGSWVRGDWKKHGKRNLFTRIALAQEAADLFASGYPYFKANCRFQIRKTPAVQPMERIQYLSPATLQYIACHPEELQPAAGRTGIRFGRRDYQPRQSLGLTQAISMETYENQVLLGFLKTLLEDVRRLRTQSGALRKAAAKEAAGGWIASPCFLLAPLRRELEDTAHPLRLLEEQLSRLLRLYSRILPIAAPKLRSVPKRTAVFRSVPEYSRIFASCRRWFQFGLLDLHGERRMLPFLKIPDLYEVYILSRLFDALENAGWSRTGSERLDYPLPERGAVDWLVPPESGNVFTFRKDGGVLTVFYQPVVYSAEDPSAGSNGVGLCRNTSISYKDEPDPYSDRAAGRGSYYFPDFLLKIQREDQTQTRYLVADAKFSSLANVERYQLPALVYKYLFSLSPLCEEDVLSGLCIFCGQSVKEGGALRNVRDLKPDAQPFAAVLTFPGGAEDLSLTELLKTCRL